MRVASERVGGTFRSPDNGPIIEWSSEADVIRFTMTMPGTVSWYLCAYIFMLLFSHLTYMPNRMSVGVSPDLAGSTPMSGADVGMASISTLRGYRVTLNDGRSSLESAAFSKAAVEMTDATVQTRNGAIEFSYSRPLVGDARLGEVSIRDVGNHCPPLLLLI
jgi:hypothetical protein